MSLLELKRKGQAFFIKGSPEMFFADTVLFADKLKERKAELMDGKQRINRKLFGIAQIINQSDTNLKLSDAFFTTCLGRKFFV